MSSKRLSSRLESNTCACVRPLQNPRVRNLDSPEWLAYERPIVAKAKAGNHRAFGSLYDAFAARLLAIYTLMLRNSAQAEDVVAETFQTGWAKIASFLSERSIFFWLRKIGKNRIVDLKRHEEIAPSVDDGWEEMLEPIELDMEGMIDLPRLQAQVHAVFAKLSESHRRALVLRYVDQLSGAECAAALAMTAGAFYTMLSRAHDAFHELWVVRAA